MKTNYANEWIVEDSFTNKELIIGLKKQFHLLVIQ